jgi:hypothetical protein
MAPIYTARHVSAADKSTPLFSLRGLKNLAPVPISQSNIFGVPLERQIAYTQYAANLSSFIHASIYNSTVIVSSAPLGYLKSRRSLPLTPPTVTLALQKELDNDRAEKFIRILGTGASRNKVGKTTIFTAPSIPKESLEKVILISASHFNGGRESVNPMGLKAYYFISAAFAEILRLHSYSAFTSETKESMNELVTLLGTPSTEYFAFKKNAKPSERNKYSTFLTSIEDEPAEPMETEEEVEETDEKKLIDHLQKSAGYVKSSGVDIVSYARPPKSPVQNYGSSNAVPESPGILFPYFTGLTQPDQTFIQKFVIENLFQLLGSSQQECQETYTQLRRGFNSLSTTDVGMELAHIGFGIDLAIKTQGRCYVVIESGKYMGFTLLGARLAIFDSTKWIGVGDAETLRDDLSCIDPHRFAVSELVKAFGSMQGSEAYTGPAVSENTFSDPKGLIEVFKGLKLDQLGDDEKELNRHFRS